MPDLVPLWPLYRCLPCSCQEYIVVLMTWLLENAFLWLAVLEWRRDYHMFKIGWPYWKFHCARQRQRNRWVSTWDKTEYTHTDIYIYIYTYAYIYAYIYIYIYTIVSNGISKSAWTDEHKMACWSTLLLAMHLYQSTKPSANKILIPHCCITDQVDEI